ncbi:hypothetical protein V6N12_043440 [Hibiscus sabdariffa]|uniref:PARP catalytic domain-containing protein n=1 Tax=Hibiscus sabdariffa TaxID=183260 RepID=A0ABR2DEB9_9ROSI
MNRIVEEDQVSMIMDNDEISEISDAMSGSNEIVSGSNCFEHFVANGFSKIDESSLETCIIQTSVSQNFQMAKRRRVVAVHKNLNTGRSWQIREHSFRVSAKAVADKCGGDARIRYAWYGASRDEICEIVTHGFSWRSKAGGGSHGISLSPAKHLLDSVLSSTVDESGLRHLLLCRVILGKQEVVTGDSSDQFHPISSEFDSGVDDISAPTKYIIWNSRLNFSILPCYIVSFEAPYLSGKKDYKAANGTESERNGRKPVVIFHIQHLHKQGSSSYQQQGQQWGVDADSWTIGVADSNCAVCFPNKSESSFLTLSQILDSTFALQISIGIEMAESKSLRKPVFTKVDQLRPGTSGHTLTVKVVSTKMVLQKGRTDGPQVRQMRIAECLVGDETGMIIFTARNEQVDTMKEGATVTLRNLKIDMFKGSMRLAVDKWGRVEVDEPASFSVKEDNNLSLIEYELVNVVEE